MSSRSVRSGKSCSSFQESEISKPESRKALKLSNFSIITEYCFFPVSSTAVTVVGVTGVTGDTGLGRSPNSASSRGKLDSECEEFMSSSRSTVGLAVSMIDCAFSVLTNQANPLSLLPNSATSELVSLLLDSEAIICSTS